MNTKDLIEFEDKVAKLWEMGELPYLIHLSGGNEAQLVSIFSRINLGDWVFSTHRNHYHALLAGVSSEKVLTAIKRGDSMYMFDKDHNFFTSALLAGCCGIAAGVAIGLKNTGNRVWCFLGDGAEEEGHFYEAVMMVEGQNLPCTFIIEDNDRAVDTNVGERTGHFRMKWPLCVERYNYIPTYPHAGNGTKNKIEFKA